MSVFPLTRISPICAVNFNAPEGSKTWALFKATLLASTLTLPPNSLEMGWLALPFPLIVTLWPIALISKLCPPVVVIKPVVKFRSDAMFIVLLPVPVNCLAAAMLTALKPSKPKVPPP